MRFINSGDAEMRGAEIEIAPSPNERWDFTLGGGVVETEIVESDVVIRAHPAPATDILLEARDIILMPMDERDMRASRVALNRAGNLGGLWL